jgi:predicted TIM-barrel fold metal-dependent hydrolase
MTDIVTPESDGGHPMRHTFCGCNTSRRGFLTGLVAAGATALLPGCAAPTANSTQTIFGNRDHIDVHHHFASPTVLAEMVSRNIAEASSLNWTVSKTLHDLDRAGTATAILSIARPQVTFADVPLATRLARASNEYAAKLGTDYKGRFGSFAMLPAQDIDASLREIEYSLDTLKADGIAMLTSFGDKYLGHPHFAPIMEELNRRKAVLFTHPTTPNCCDRLVADVPVTVVEYGTDTTRTIANIVFSGTAARYPDIKFIFSHAGGTLPFLTERFLKLPGMDKKLEASVPNGVLYELQKFYYDTAWSATPYALSSLLKLVKTEQVLFGSDYPYRTNADTMKGLIEYGFTQSDLDAITRGNAVRLLPRWRA